MRFEEKTYEVPEEAALLFDEYSAMDDLVKIYVKVPFGYKKAVKCQKKSTISRRKFWNMIYNLYPCLTGKRLRYEPNEKTVYVYKEQEEK